MQEPIQELLEGWQQSALADANLCTAQEQLQKTHVMVAEMQRTINTRPAQERLRLKHHKAKILALVENEAQRRLHYDRLHAQVESYMWVLELCGDCLQRAGAMLCALLPSRFCCNNPYCSSLSTASEGFLLVRGQSCVCGGCLMGSRRPVLAPTFCTAAR
jgi:hypothetical protein